MAIKNVNLVSKEKIEGIEDDQFYSIKDEFQQIRTSLGMYISKDGTDGALHLIKEILNNALDECNSSNSYWKNKKKRITVEFYESKREVIITDNGRGIPTDLLVDVVMHKHTSTKTMGISTIRNKKQAGLNGTGLTVTAALTDFMEMTSFRHNVYKTINFDDGVLIEHPPKKLKEFRNGTSVTIIPSTKYLGNIELTNDLVENFLRNLSYILEKDIIITLVTEKDSKAKKIEKVVREFKPQGLASCCNYMSSSLEFPPIELKYESEMFDLSLAFSYDKTIDEMNGSSYANYIVTTEGGSHITAITRALCEYFTREGKRLDPNSKYEITYDDCRKGLIYAVNLEHCEPKFEGQHKSRVSNKDVLDEGKKGIVQDLTRVMGLNPSLLKRIITYLRQISRIRLEANKIKGVTVKKMTSFLDDNEIKKFFPVSNRNTTGYTECLLCEGDSAAGGVMNARNPKYQALYAVQGVSANVHDLSLTQLLQKSMFKDLVQILGCGIDKDFDINKLRYDKIIICTDADADGLNISSLLLCFFFIFMPEIISSGKLYKAMPPLYLMEMKSLSKIYKGREWLYDKKEYYNMINTIIVNNVEIAIELPKSRKKVPEVIPMDKKETLKWLEMNSEYLIELQNLGKKAATNTTILEDVCFLRRSSKSELEFKKSILELYPEMKYDVDNKILIGVWNKEHFSLVCDSIFDRSAYRFIGELNKNPSLYIWYKLKGNDKFVRATIGEFFAHVMGKYNVKIDQRFKGIGEVETDLLFRTTTNPKFRKLIKIDINDIPFTKDTFELLHGKSPKLREMRRDLLDSVKLSYADIDN